MEMNLSNTNLNETFQLSKEEALKTFYERMITIPITAISSLKNELYTTIGRDRTKGIFIRYGYHSGVSDGKKAMACKWDNKVDLIKAGPKFHQLHGYVGQVDIDAIAFSREDILESIDILWFDSFEAAEFMKNEGESDTPVCHTLCGYASGYLSTVLSRPIIVKETKCRAMGYEKCEATCMPMEKWGPELEKESRYYQSSSMIQELDEITEKLKIERDYLNKANKVHQELIERLLTKQGLQGIVDILHQTTNLCTWIEDEHHEMMVKAGNDDLLSDYPSIDIKEGKHRETNYMKTADHIGILRSPIYFERQIKGYCIFLYEEDREPNDLEYMLIEQATLTASITLLNENIRLHTEENIKRGFLNDILENRVEKEELFKIAQYLNFNPGDYYWMITLERHINKDELNKEIEINEDLVGDINAFLKRKSINGIVAQRMGQIIILIEDSSFKELNMKQLKFTKELLKYCTKRFSNNTFKIGISSTLPNIDQLLILYNETLAALQTANTKNMIQFFDDLGVESILYQIPDDILVDRFVKKQVGRLLEVDKNMELVATLYAYIENGININTTAKATAMSISGLRYRLEKISDILELDLNDTPSLFSIYIALKLLKSRGIINI